MAQDNTLVPAIDLAGKNKAHFPDGTSEYRQARNALLAEEIELRRHIERVAALRRELPLGGAVPKDDVDEMYSQCVSPPDWRLHFRPLTRRGTSARCTFAILMATCFGSARASSLKSRNRKPMMSGLVSSRPDSCC